LGICIKVNIEKTKCTRIFVYKYYGMRDKIKSLINKFFETVLGLMCYVEYNKLKSHSTKNLYTGLNLAEACNHSVVKRSSPTQKSTEMQYYLYV